MMMDNLSIIDVMCFILDDLGFKKRNHYELVCGISYKYPMSYYKYIFTFHQKILININKNIILESYIAMPNIYLDKWIKNTQNNIFYISEEQNANIYKEDSIDIFTQFVVKNISKQK